MRLKDFFPGHAARTPDVRPAYPAELFAWLSDQCAVHDVAWDASCGDGRAAVALTSHFHDVFASDPSHESIKHAIPHPDVQYRVEPADQCGLSDRTADLVALEDGIRRVDREGFHREAMRVAKPHGVVATWWLGPMRVEPAIDHVIDRLHDGLLKPFARQEERDWANHYRSLPFPYDEMAAPTLEVREQWNLQRVFAYLESWPALHRCREETRHDPLYAARSLISAHWGAPDTQRTVVFPMHLRVGRVH
jgi:ubiquinone/menaquinone biosynthesis C-methylase UbiE